MNKAILVGALLLMGGTAVALPSSNILATGTGPLTGDIIVKVLGYRPETMTMTTFTDRGMETREVSFEDLSAALANTALGNAQDGPVASSRCRAAAGLGLYCGPDYGQGTLNAGPFCDNSSGWISHSGNPGDTYTALNGPGATSVVTCLGFFGKTFNWDEVEMDALQMNLGAGVAYEGCFATKWNIHSDTYCPNPFTGQDTFLWHWRASGTGVATSFGAPGAAFDYFLGNGATNGYDLPAGVLGP